MKNHALVLGASENPQRYANMAIRRLRQHRIPVHAVGLRTGKVEDVEIVTGQPLFTDVDTVTLYIGPKNQTPLHDYILKLNPRRVIFNPGTEDNAFESKLRASGIIVEEACTLVLLGTGQY